MLVGDDINFDGSPNSHTKTQNMKSRLPRCWLALPLPSWSLLPVMTQYISAVSCQIHSVLNMLYMVSFKTTSSPPLPTWKICVTWSYHLHTEIFHFFLSLIYSSDSSSLMPLAKTYNTTLNITGENDKITCLCTSIEIIPILPHSIWFWLWVWLCWDMLLPYTFSLMFWLRKDVVFYFFLLGQAIF